MATVKPFAAVLPAPGLEKETAALPYDVYNEEEARAAVAGHPLSFLNIDRPETQFPAGTDPYSMPVYEKARDMIRGRLADGTFVQDPAPCYYLYALTRNGRTQTGIVGCSSVDDYMNGVIRRHENTRREKEEDRVNHVNICSAQTGPIFLAYRHNAELRDLIGEVQMTTAPFFDFTEEDGVRHTGTRISDPDLIAKFEAALGRLPATYIADGHHRAASAVRVSRMRREQNPDYTGEEPFNYFLSVLFPDDELNILPYNRVVKDLNGMTPAEFMKKISEHYQILSVDKPFQPVKKGTMGMYIADSWFELSYKESIPDDPIRGLDCSILQDTILQPILGISDPRSDPRIDFVGGIRGLSELEKRVHTDSKAAFAMVPTQISELLRVADNHLLMPPKSTWFEPKLRSGLFIHLI
ncbi:MAG: DUF1015 domain-containing protein [Lachnospiraceae bacterium]|jgi:uncharacterized protein (DUF1015 family)